MCQVIYRSYERIVCIHNEPFVYNTKLEAACLPSGMTPPRIVVQEEDNREI